MKLAVMHGIGKELTRDELKNVFGGTDPEGSGSGSYLAGCSIERTCPDGAKISCNGDHYCSEITINGKKAVECDSIAYGVCK